MVVGYTPSTNAAAARIQDLAGNAAEAIRPTEALNYTQEEAEPEPEPEPEPETEPETEPEESEESEDNVTTTDETGEEEEKTPLTVSLEASPDSHNGTDVFTFEIRFSEEFGLSYVTLRDKAFNVTGGKVDKAQRKQPGSNIGWTITVEPHGNGTVSITLPETTHCNDDGAICTADWPHALQLSDPHRLRAGPVKVGRESRQVWTVRWDRRPHRRRDHPGSEPDEGRTCVRGASLPWAGRPRLRKWQNRWGRSGRHENQACRSARVKLH